MGNPTIFCDLALILGRDRVQAEGRPNSSAAKQTLLPVVRMQPWALNRSGRCVTCGELGGKGVHFLVHHLLVQSPQAKRLHRERQGPGQHSIHVHTSEKRDTRA